jgi:hypothetical protein
VLIKATSKALLTFTQSSQNDKLDFYETQFYIVIKQCKT